MKFYTCKPLGATHLDANRVPAIDAALQDLSRVTKAALKALLKANDPPFLFRFGGRPAWIELGDNGAPIVRAIDQNGMRFLLARTMRWYYGSKKDGKPTRKPAMPPVDVVRDILATPNLPLPVLSRLIEVPVFAPGGSLQVEPGYNAATQCYYHPAEGFSLPPVSEQPSSDEVARARKLLVDDLLGDFPFTGDAEKANAIALLLLPFVCDMIQGPTPLHLLEKPTPGTGATLLAEMLAFPAVGRALPIMSEARGEEEMRKRITAKLRDCPPVLLFDNLRKLLDSPALSAALTCRTWEDRLLGHSQMIHVAVRCVWIATGNNPTLSNEIARRTVRIRLDAKMDRPWLRTSFRHENLVAWVGEHRSDLVWAALTLVHAWLAAGRPAGPNCLGMFENWARTMGGILEVAEVHGFLGNLSEFYEESDVESDIWCAFFTNWWEQHGDQQVSTADVLVLSEELDLGSGSEQNQKIRLGKMLGQIRDRVFGKLRLVRAGTYQGTLRWRLVREDGEGRLAPPQHEAAAAKVPS